MIPRLPPRTSPMNRLPTWALLSIVVLCILLSPIIAFFLALGAEIVIVDNQEPWHRGPRGSGMGHVRLARCGKN